MPLFCLQWGIPEDVFKGRLSKLRVVLGINGEGHG